MDELKYDFDSQTKFDMANLIEFLDCSVIFASTEVQKQS